MRIRGGDRRIRIASRALGRRSAVRAFSPSRGRCHPKCERAGRRVCARAEREPRPARGVVEREHANSFGDPSGSVSCSRRPATTSARRGSRVGRTSQTNSYEIGDQADRPQPRAVRSIATRRSALVLQAVTTFALIHGMQRRSLASAVVRRGSAEQRRDGDERFEPHGVETRISLGRQRVSQTPPPRGVQRRGYAAPACSTTQARGRARRARSRRLVGSSPVLEAPHCLVDGNATMTTA